MAKRVWRVIAEDGNGKIHIFVRIVDEAANGVEKLENWVREHDAGLTIIAMYREMDVTEYLVFDGE